MQPDYDLLIRKIADVISEWNDDIRANSNDTNHWKEHAATIVLNPHGCIVINNDAIVFSNIEY